MSKLENMFKEVLASAGITINGSNPWDIQIYNPQVYSMVMSSGSLGLGEAYMAKMWDCSRLDQFFERILAYDIEGELGLSQKLKFVSSAAKEKIKTLVNPQSIERCKFDVPHHYDIGNRLYRKMLDSRMTYTCGYWNRACSLDEAQEHKLDLICRKLDLKPGMRILDIGCGWGSFMIYASTKYGVICDGLTLSQEQKKLGTKLAIAHDVLPNFIIKDYREFKPTYKYDRVVSIGMVEHVGPQNYSEYFECADRFLKDNGIFLLHTIGSPKSTYASDPWISKYIFPNGVIPSMKQLSEAMENLFNIEDVHNFGEDYDKTLVHWFANFQKSWDQLKRDYNEEFYRMWKYYLLSCAGAFRSRDLSVWQLVLTKIGRPQPMTVRSM
ncbi:cyclopropane fatty acyl phospholipid synthase [Vibrio sp. TRT 17S01]|uniref:cyclopropane fatty acyl phospholipid synthase n=1 Tax=Vibrio sp. TRT 17S01 TaxID=3418505 RepID=UPI003CF61DD5